MVATRMNFRAITTLKVIYNNFANYINFPLHFISYLVYVIIKNLNPKLMHSVPGGNITYLKKTKYLHKTPS